MIIKGVSVSQLRSWHFLKANESFEFWRLSTFYDAIHDWHLIPSFAILRRLLLLSFFLQPPPKNLWVICLEIENKGADGPCNSSAFFQCNTYDAKTRLGIVAILIACSQVTLGNHAKQVNFSFWCPGVARWSLMQWSSRLQTYYSTICVLEAVELWNIHEL